MSVGRRIFLPTRGRLRSLEPADVREYFGSRTRIDPQSGCWIWLGALHNGEHGKLGYQGKTFAAHRLAYAALVSPIPEGFCVCHRCDTPACVNPAHLFAGTQQANVSDMVAKNRHRFRPLQGEANPGAKLTAAHVEEIRKRNKSQRRLAAEYGVSRSTIAQILRGNKWRADSKPPATVTRRLVIPIQRPIVTDNERAVLLALYSAGARAATVGGDGFVRPMDFGGAGKTPHSQFAGRFVRLGLVEAKDRKTGRRADGKRKNRLYRITADGCVVLDRHPPSWCPGETNG